MEENDSTTVAVDVEKIIGKLMIQNEALRKRIRDLERNRKSEDE